MYKHTLNVYGEALASAQDLPQNDSADGNGGTASFGGTMGGLQAVAEVDEDIILSATKTLNIKLQHRDGDDAFEDLGDIFNMTTAATYSAPAGAVLGRMVIPTNCKEEGKAVITTDDAAADGKINVEIELLPG